MGMLSLGTTTTALLPSRISSIEMEFWLAISKMKGIRGTQPLGGSKYYNISITDIGMARIVHEAMLLMTSRGAVQVSLVAEERGFEVIEYNLLLMEEMGEEEDGFFVMCRMGKF